ncbi:MAG: peptidyl-prolyl cis-trans isomerase [Gemmatimonadota bacterium]
MMKQLRESTKIIMVVVAFSFVSLMIFDWGMDLSGRSNTGGGSNALGSVNGAEIPLEMYQRQYQMLYEQAQARTPDGDLSPDELDAIETQAWDEVVTLILLREEARRRGIEIRDSELIEFIKYNPPQELVGLPAFQTSGQFDPAKYQQALGDPTLAQTWADYEAQLRETLPIQKLQEQIIAGVAVTDAELLEAWRTRHEKARVATLFLDPERLVPDQTIAITREEIRAWYDDHRGTYHREASAAIRAVAFAPRVGAADSAAVRARADSLAGRAAGPDADFAELARRHSDDAISAQNGGDLGWVRPAAMDPAFASALSGLEPGGVSAPVLTPFGWHVIKLINRQEQDGETRARASQILLAIEPPESARKAARDSAQAFARAASADAAAFASAAAARGLTVISPPPFEQGIVIPSLGPAPALAEFVFANAAGSVSGALEQDNVYYVVRVDARYPEGYVALDRVADEIRVTLQREKKLAAVRELAPRIRDAVRQQGLEGAAARHNLEVRTTDFFTRANNIPGIGSGTAVAGAAFGLAQGQVAGPIEGPRGLYFIRLLELQPYDPTAFEREKGVLRDELKGQKTRETFETWLEALRERAEIEDNRALLLGT